MSKKAKDPAVYVWDMLHEIEFIERTVTQGSIYDDLLSRALLRAFTVLGEAAKRVNAQVQEATPQIPWQKIVDTRNFLSHDYEEVNLQKIEGIITDHLPLLKTNLLALYTQLTGTHYHAN